MSLNISRAKIKDSSEEESKEVSPNNKPKRNIKDQKRMLRNKKKKIQKTMFSLYLEDKIKLEEMVNDISSELQWEGMKADNSKLIRILIDKAYDNFDDIKDEMVVRMKNTVKEVTELSVQRNTASRTRKADKLV